MLSRHPHFISKLLAPLTSLVAEPKIDQTCEAILGLLKTWSGFLCVMLENNGCQDLIDGLRTKPHEVVRILKGILLLDGPVRSVVGSFCGFAFHLFVEAGLLKRLEDLAETDSEFTEFLLYLNSFSSARNETAATRCIFPTHFTVPAVDDRGFIRKISLSLIGKDFTNAFPGFRLQGDSNQWDWNALYGFIVVVLPHDEGEAQSPAALAFYGQLLEYFGARFPQEGIGRTVVQISLVFARLLDFLVSAPWGRLYLETRADFGRGLVQAFRAFGGSEPSSRSSTWLCVREFLLFACTEVGVDILTKWRLIEDIATAARSYRVSASARMIAKEIYFSDHWLVGKTIILAFLQSESSEIAKVAHDEFREKCMAIESTNLQHLNDTLVEYIQSTTNSPSFPRALKLFCEVLLTNPDFLVLAASNRHVHQFVRDSAREVYCVLLREERWLRFGDIRAEVQYWMSEGIFAYLLAYDEAVEWTLNQNGPEPQWPSVIWHGGRALVPPHPFSEFTKTPLGLHLLFAQLPCVFALCESENTRDRRAALFCLGHFAADSKMWAFVDEYHILEEMVKAGTSMDSYLVKGTLLNALSLVSMMPKVADRLYSLGFTVVNFGENSCVVPVDANSMIIPVSTRVFVAPEILTPPSKAVQSVADLLSPLTRDRAKNELSGISINDLASYDNTIFVHRLLMSHKMDHETCEFVVSLFRRIPLVPADESPVDLRQEAEAYARLIESQAHAQNDQAFTTYTFATLPIPQMRVPEVPRARPGALLGAEVYISDEDFMATTGVDKDTFYRRCTNEQRLEVREFIMRSS
jgi:hypothetical protein